MLLRVMAKICIFFLSIMPCRTWLSDGADARAFKALLLNDVCDPDDVDDRGVPTVGVLDPELLIFEFDMVLRLPRFF